MFVQHEGETRMKITEPKLEDRNAQHYMGIRAQVPWSEFKKVVPQFLGEVFAWLEKQGVAPAGPPFMRYYVINMESNMDIELGVPVASALSGDDRIRAGILPAGRYASLIYTGVSNGIKGNGALLDWGAQKGLVWDRWDVENGDAFASRVEFYLTDPAEEPHQAEWETEVAIRLADDQPR
jgi:effector-binding domain-containing protein